MNSASILAAPSSSGPWKLKAGGTRLFAYSLMFAAIWCLPLQGLSQDYPPAIKMTDGNSLNVSLTTSWPATYYGGFYGTYAYDVFGDFGSWDYNTGYWDLEDVGHWDTTTGYSDATDGSWVQVPTWVSDWEEVWIPSPTWMPNWTTQTFTATAYFTVWVGIGSGQENNVSLSIENGSTGNNATYTASYDFTSGIFSAPGFPYTLTAVHTDGSAWAPTPPQPTNNTVGPPAMWVDGTVYSWSYAHLNDDATAWDGDVYGSGAGAYVLVQLGSVTGYNFPDGTWSGSYVNGVFESTSGHDVRAADVSGNVIFASAPAGLSPAVRVDGNTPLWVYLGSGATGAVYAGDQAGQRLLIDTQSHVSIQGDSSNIGLYKHGAIWMPVGGRDVRAVSLSGVLQTPTTQPSVGPPAVWVTGTTWRYVGTWASGDSVPTGTSPAVGDYYLGDNSGQSVFINPSGNVTLTNLDGSVATGTYANGPDSSPKVFTIAGHNDVYPGNASGTFHQDQPGNGPPAIWVNDIVFSFVTSNEDASQEGVWVDCYSDGAGDQFQVRPAGAGGVLGYAVNGNLMWSGAYEVAPGGSAANGVFVPDTGNGVHFDVRASSGVGLLQAGGTPQAGHPAIVKVDGYPWHFGGSTGGDQPADFYFGCHSGQRLWIESNGTVGFSTGTDSAALAGWGVLSGTVFVVTGHDLRACTSDNRPMAPTGTPQWGPPAVWVNGTAWAYMGTVSDNSLQIHADYYGGINATQVLTVNASVNGSSQVSGAFSGNYAGGVFLVANADLRAVNSNGSLVAPTTSPASGNPSTLRIGGLHWQYLGSTGGVDYYASTQSGQRLSIGANGAVTYSDLPDNIINATGLYANGAYTAVSGGSAFTQGTINGNLDILGNILSMGSLTDDSNSPGLTLSFSDNGSGANGYQSTVMFAGGRPVTNWLWSHAVGATGSDTVPMMSLDSQNRLILYNPTDPTQPPLILDPAGQTSYLAPQGDLSMGEFTHTPQN